MLRDLLHRIRRKFIKLRLQPIRVYCMHHVCAEFDAESMNKCDWMQIDEFKRKVLAMQQDGVEFISLTDAYQHICKDWVRRKRYAVLTFDDGYASLKEILPWLSKYEIPVTLFLNPAYFDGKHYRNRCTERYLSNKEVQQLHKQYPLLTIGSHGWEHIDATKQTKEEFEESVSISVGYINHLPNYISFFAFTYGRYTNLYLDVIKAKKIIPLFVNGEKNYMNEGYIDRELM